MTDKPTFDSIADLAKWRDEMWLAGGYAWDGCRTRRQADRFVLNRATNRELAEEWTRRNRKDNP